MNVPNVPKTAIAVWTDLNHEEFKVLAATQHEFLHINIPGDYKGVQHVHCEDEGTAIEFTDRLLIYDPITDIIQVRARVNGSEEVSREEPLGHMLVIKEVQL